MLRGLKQLRRGSRSSWVFIRLVWGTSWFSNCTYAFILLIVVTPAAQAQIAYLAAFSNTNLCIHTAPTEVQRVCKTRRAQLHLILPKRWLRNKLRSDRKVLINFEMGARSQKIYVEIGKEMRGRRGSYTDFNSTFITTDTDPISAP